MKHLIISCTALLLLGACEGYTLSGHIPELATQERADQQIDIDKGASDDGSTCTLKERNKGICKD